jgi:hypothetical protein
MLTRELGFRLRSAMTEGGITSNLDVAQALGRGQSTVCRWLRGTEAIRDIDLGALLNLCGVHHPQWNEWLALSQARSGSELMRLAGERRVSGYRDHISLAERVVEFAATYVPWLAQTPAYTQALTELPSATPAAQLLGLTPDCPTLTERNPRAKPPRKPAWMLVLVPEWTLRAPVGGPGVMAEQYAHLLWLATQPHVQVRVVPTSASAAVRVVGSFGLVISLEHRPVVLRHEPDLLVGCDGPAYVSGYERAVGRLTAAAWDADASAEFIRELETTTDPGAPGRARTLVSVEGQGQ